MGGRMKASLLLVLVAACGVDHSDRPILDDDGKADGPVRFGPIQWIDPDAAFLVSELQCMAGNGAHELGTYEPDALDVDAVSAAIAERDEARGCHARTYSTSRDDAVERFETFVASERAQTRLADCTEGDLSPEQLETEARAMVGEGTLGVFASIPADDDAGCDYTVFHLLRTDGTAIRLDFDYSD